MFCREVAVVEEERRRTSYSESALPKIKSTEPSM